MRTLGVRLTLLVAASVSALALGDSVPRSALTGGGVSTSDGGLVLRGAIGQPATNVLTGGGFTVIGGFLPSLAAATPDGGGPDAGITDAGNADAGNGADGGIDDAGTTADAGLADAGGVNAPRITSITPSHGPAGQSTPVVVLGSGFIQGTQAIIGGALLSGITVDSAAVLSGAVPSSLAAGSYDVVIANPDGQTATLAKGFTADPVDSVADAGNGDGKKGACGCGTSGSELQVFLGLLAALAWRRRRSGG